MDVKYFYCDLCDYKTKRKYDLERHHNAIHILKGYNTRLIQNKEEEVIQNKEEEVIQNKEEEVIQNEEEINQDKYECYKCAKKYKTKKYLLSHQDKCTGLSILTCPKCMKKFSNTSNKSAHIKNNNCKLKNFMLNLNYLTIPEIYNFIYLIKEREFIITSKNIYKIGKTTQQNNKRLNAYPKGSVLIFHMMCNDCDNIEKILLKKFKNIFLIKKEYGNEYFEGNHLEMIKTIYNTILTIL
jgi:hypothetical protein